MTLEQLLCPAVFEWYESFKSRLNESNTQMTADQIENEFDKWLIENEDKVNESVNENRKEFNESLQESIKEYKKLNEGLFDDIVDGTDDADIQKDEPLSIEDTEKDSSTTKSKTSIVAAIKLSSSTKAPADRNVFVAINNLVKYLVKKGKNKDTNEMYFRKLDVSEVLNMTALFAFADIPNADLSSWDTSNVEHMEGMFYKSTFNNDSICKWNVSSCADFKNMFSYSKFNQSLKAWTPKFIKITERDPSTGELVERDVRAPLPLVGASADEELEYQKRYWNDIFDEIQEEEKSKVEEGMRYVLDYDTFINEGKIGDFVKKGFNKVKEAFKTIALKLKNVVAVFNEKGEMYPAVSAYTTINTIASGAVKGVNVFTRVKNEYINDNVQEKPSIVKSAEYYGIIDKDSIEYRNYQTFKSMVNEHYEKYGNTGALKLNEDYDRVGLSAEDGGLIGIPDIDSKGLTELLNDIINNAPAYTDDGEGGGSALIWGAPGIGKSTIPKSVIRTWNNEHIDDKKAIIIVECGNLTPDGFTLPIPIKKEISEYLDEQPKVRDIILKNKDKKFVSGEKLNSLKLTLLRVTTDSPKTWLPCYKPTGDQEETKTLDAIANGRVLVENKKGGVKVTNTTEGGLILFDEFFRADELVFKVLMQIVLNRSYNNEFFIGSKWGIIACSNRPKDDTEVNNGYGHTGPVVGNRFGAGQYNFIPDFNEWKKWAVTEGGFDDLTLTFLTQNKDSKTGEYTNWHTIKPDEYTTNGKSAWPTPRTWSLLIHEINLYKKNHGSCPLDIIRLKAGAIIGKEMGDRYVNFLKTYGKTDIDVESILNNPKYKIPNPEPKGSNCSEVCNRVLDAIRVMFDSENLPTLNQLMNVYNNINNTYPASKDNRVKMMHIDIIKHLNAVNDPKIRKLFGEYLDDVTVRYKLERKDFI